MAEAGKEPFQRTPDSSRLARMIRRLETQRIALEWAAAEISGLPGPVIELGLGKGRTYDHLRLLMPEREILVFDKLLHAPKDCIPPEADFFLGDFLETAGQARERIGEGAVLAHADIGSDDREKDARRVAAMAPVLDRLLRPGALVLSDREMHVARWQRVDVPNMPSNWVYYAWRVVGA
ncbi:MAG: class I SAM-dependent methyltransferase [Rhodovibrionaceae bacterium]|nr:class I SAM-dependent methyltransferase [Rhodovibrionaceae bacterium]